MSYEIKPLVIRPRIENSVDYRTSRPVLVKYRHRELQWQASHYCKRMVGPGHVSPARMVIFDALTLETKVVFSGGWKNSTIRQNASLMYNALGITFPLELLSRNSTLLLGDERTEGPT